MDESDDDDITKTARERFGIPYLFPYQRLVVANIMDIVRASADRARTAACPGHESGEPVEEAPSRQMVILPTGAGKSLCFQLPAALLPGPTLVVYPLLGLMSDQRRRLERSGMPTEVLRGGMEAGDKAQALSRIRAGSARIIIANPEVLSSPGVAEALAAAGLSHCVVDEAHCVSEWGDSFRPAYLQLGDALAALRPTAFTAFTATASPPVLARVAELLWKGEPYRLVMGSPDRPGIRYEVRPALSMTRALRQAVAALRKPLIVFAPSRPGVELLAEDLRLAFPGMDARFYHAGLSKAERSALEAWFLASKDGVLVATCAYGMGMDKPDIRSVVHYGPPSSVEAYLQESGRAGRDGEPARAVLLRPAEARDYGASEPGSGASTPQEGEPAPADRRAETMRRYASGGYGCRRAFLLSALGPAGQGQGSGPDGGAACPSCDHCDGNAIQEAEGSRTLAATLGRHARRFDAAGAARFLGARRGGVTAPYRGALEGWGSDEIEEAIAKACELGLARRLAGPLWRGRLMKARGYSGRSESRKSSDSSSSVSSGGGAAGAALGAFLRREGKLIMRLLDDLNQGSAT